MPRLLAILAAALLCASLPAACGNDDDSPATPKQRYEAEFKRTIKTWQEKGKDDVPDVAEDAPLAEQAVAMEQAVVLMRRLAGDLADIPPPAEVRAAHRDYVRGMQGVANDMTVLVAAMHRGDAQAVDRALSGTGFAKPANVRLLATARATFQRRGYDLGMDELPLPAGP